MKTNYITTSDDVQLVYWGILPGVNNISILDTDRDLQNLTMFSLSIGVYRKMQTSFLIRIPMIQF